MLFIMLWYDYKEYIIELVSKGIKMQTWFCYFTCLKGEEEAFESAFSDCKKPQKCKFSLKAQNSA
jgi:hypothetical protein